MDMVNASPSFPEVEWVAGWPENRSRSSLIVLLALSTAFLVLATMQIIGAPWSAGITVFLGAAGLVSGFLGIAYLFGSVLHLYLPRRSAGVLISSRDQYGLGVQLATDRGDVIRLAPGMAGLSVYAFCGWLDWRTGGNDLLPMSKSNTGGATLALVFSIVLAFIVVFFAISVLAKWGVEVYLYPSGILRRAEVPFVKNREDFVPWHHVAGLAPDLFSSGKAKDLPVINVELADKTAPPTNKMYDKPGILVIPAYLYKSDKNSLLSILLFLKDNPDKAGLLANPDVPQWFLEVERRGRELQRAANE